MRLALEGVATAVNASASPQTREIVVRLTGNAGPITDLDLADAVRRGQLPQSITAMKKALGL